VVGGCCGWKVSRGLFEHEPCRWLVSGIGPDGQGKWSKQNGQGQILEARRMPTQNYLGFQIPSPHFWLQR
jgi:hypothetical protein